MRRASGDLPPPPAGLTASGSRSSAFRFARGIAWQSGRQTVYTQIAAGSRVDDYDRPRELAVSLRVSSVFAERRDPDPAETPALAPVLGHSAKDLQARSTTDRTSSGSNATRATSGDAISDLSLKESGWPRESASIHAGAGLARPGMWAGGPRLEGWRSCTTTPRGKPQFVVAQQDAWAAGLQTRRAGAAGPIFDVHLTIDEVLQYIAERELARAVERSGRVGQRRRAGPCTGEILAWPISPPSTRTATRSRQRRQAKPRHHRLLRAGLDLQGDPYRGAWRRA